MRQPAWICGVDSPRALPFFPINLLIGALISSDWCSSGWALLLLHTTVTSVESTITEEAIMAIAIGFGALVGVFVLGGALILFWPYDR
jgi:hypothetical protein